MCVSAWDSRHTAVNVNMSEKRFMTEVNCELTYADFRAPARSVVGTDDPAEFSRIQQIACSPNAR